MIEQKITITIPVWERYDFFEQAIESALGQTSKPEIVVVDNASSHTKFADYVAALGDPSVRYFRNEVNIGMYGNWNRCAELAETPYFFILGDDDILDLSFCEKAEKILSEHGELDCVYCNLERFGNANTEHPDATVPFGLVSGADLLKSAAIHGPNFPTNAMLLNKKLFASNRFLEASPALNQDWLFVYQALATSRCYGFSEAMLKCRVHTGGNALIVGAKAHLSTALVLNVVSKKLQEAQFSQYAQLAARKNQWIPRNSLIHGHKQQILDLLKLAPDYPFSSHLSECVAHDRLLSLALKSDGVMLKAIVALLRLLRKLHSRQPLPLS